MNRTSIERLSTVHPELQAVVNVVAKRIPIVVVSGHRGEEEQNRLFGQGRSKVQFPNSDHNTIPSLAVDIAPKNEDGSIPWNDLSAFAWVAGYAVAVGHMMGIGIKSGLDWDQDMITTDQSFRDGPHLALTDPDIRSEVERG